MSGAVISKNSLGALPIVANAAQKNSTIPILDHLRLHMAGGKLSVCANNLDFQVTLEVACDGTGSWESTVHAGLFGGAIAAARGEISLKREDDGTLIASGGARHRLNSLDVRDFPELEPDKDAKPALVDANDLDFLLRTVSAFQNQADDRPYLCGVYFHVVGDKLVAWGSNGISLARAQVPAGELPEDFSGIVSRETVPTIEKIVGMADTLDVSLGNKLVMRGAGISLLSKLVEGTYPDYGPALPDPASAAFSCEVVASDLGDALAQVMPYLSPKKTAVKFELDADTLTLSVRNDEGRGDASASIGVDTKSKPITFGLGAHLLGNVLKSLPKGTTNLSISTKGLGEHIRIDPIGRDDFLFVIAQLGVK